MNIPVSLVYLEKHAIRFYIKGFGFTYHSLGDGNYTRKDNISFQGIKGPLQQISTQFWEDLYVKQVDQIRVNELISRIL